MISAEKAAGVLERARALRGKGKAPEEVLAWLEKKLPGPDELPAATRAGFARFLLDAEREDEALQIGLQILEAADDGELGKDVREWVSENLGSFRDRTAALDACWMHHARGGDWDGGRRLVKLASREAPEALPGLEQRARERSGNDSTAPFAHAALAHIALAQGNLAETVLRLRSCLYGPRALAQHSAMALKRLKEKRQDNPDISWALLEAGHLTGEDWVDEALGIASRDPERMAAYLREALPRSTPATREGLLVLARQLTRRHPGLAAAWEILGDLQKDDPRSEVETRSEVVKLLPGSEPAREAVRRIEEISEEEGGDLDIAFGRIRALMYLPDLGSAMGLLRGRSKIDPARALALIDEARGSGVALTDDFHILEADCLHLLGRDPAAAERIREAKHVSAPLRVDALHRMRADAPYSPDLACALAEVYLLGDGFVQAETLLVGLLEQAPATAKAVLEWLDGAEARPLVNADGANALRARAELAAGQEKEAVGRIAVLAGEGDPRSGALLNIASAQRIKAVPSEDLDLDMLRLLVDSGQDSKLALRFVRRLREAGADGRVAEVLGNRNPGDESTEEEWLRTLGALNVDLGRVEEAVAVARSGSSTRLVFDALGQLADRVGEADRWMVQEALAEVQLATEAAPEDVLAVLTGILDAWPDRTEAVEELLDRCTVSDDCAARRLILRGRCGQTLGRLGEATRSFLYAAEAATGPSKATDLDECARRLLEVIEQDSDDDEARIALSRVGRLRGSVEETLAPVRDAPVRTPALTARLGEIREEFPEAHDAEWTAVEWHRAGGNHAEALAGLERLLSSAPDSAERAREAAEEVYGESGAVGALRVAADADRRLGEAEREAGTCLRIFEADAGTADGLLERLSSLSDLHPSSVTVLTTSLEVAASSGHLDGLLDAARRTLVAKLDPEGFAACARALKAGEGLRGSASSSAFWSSQADLRLLAGDVPGAVEACRRLVGIGGDPERGVERRLLAMREDGALPVAGLDLLIGIHRAALEPDLLARSIRWRLDAGDPSPDRGREIRDLAESAVADGCDSPELRTVLEDFCIEGGDAEGALDQLLAGAGSLGPGALLARLDRLAGRFADAPRVPVEAALRVHAPAGRSGEAALAVERAFDLDPDLGLTRGLPCLRELLADGKGEPELLRVAARLATRAGDDQTALDCLNRLEEAGDEHRDVVASMFGRLAESCPANLEARLRWAEVLAGAAGGEGDSRGAWEDCALRCREALGKGPSPEEELRATKLLAVALRGSGAFEEAHKALRGGREKYPEDAELPKRIRENHLAHLTQVREQSGTAAERALALIRGGRSQEALGILDAKVPEEEGEEPDVLSISVRIRAHYDCGHFDWVASEYGSLVTDLPATGPLDPHLQEILYYKGRALLRVGEEAGGIRMLERLAREHPCHRACRAFLEDRYRRQDAGEEQSITLTAGLEEVHHGQA